MWPFFIPLLHASNKGLLAWAVAPELRDLVVRVADVGFLGFFGALAALASAAPAHTLVGLRFALVKVGLAHMLLETLVNGVLLPMHRCPEKGARSPTLRPGIWAHHVLATLAFAAVLISGEFVQESVFLCTTEVTAALPPAMQELRRARRETSEPELAAALVVLLVTGFAFRCAVSWAVVVPNARVSVRSMLELARGEAVAPGVAAARGVVWSCAVGLGALNAHWMHRVLLGARKAVAKAMAGGGGGAARNAEPKPKPKGTL